MSHAMPSPAFIQWQLLEPERQGPDVVSADAGQLEARQWVSEGWRRLRWAGPLMLALAIGAYAVNLALHQHVVLGDTDLVVYRGAGLAARRSPGQLYSWQLSPGVQFTYTPFAAAFCVVISVLPWGLVAWAMLAGSVAALLQTIWLTLGALGWAGSARLGLTAAVSAVAFWSEPVQRTLHAGEIDLLLMLLVVRDLAGPERRWRGAGVGLAAGIKLVALIFIPYLLMTRQYRQACVAAGAFAATAAAGALLFPHASVSWWLGGAFASPQRTGFVGYLANQSLLGAITRQAATVPPTAAWLVPATLLGSAGLLLAAVLHRRGLPVHGWVVCALTGLLVSPVSWDHHWVWIALVLVVLADMAARAHGVVRAACWGSACLVAVAFAAWPSLWQDGGAAVPWGLIWYAPASPNYQGASHPEYHWAGLQLIAGNLYLLIGVILLAAAAAIAVAARPGHAAGRPHGSVPERVAGGQLPADSAR